MPIIIERRNQSSVVTDAEAQTVTAAIQAQVTEDFAPIWGIDATLNLVAASSSPGAGAWLEYILDDSDQAGALGYHDDDPGTPMGYIFAKSTQDAGEQWSVCDSHETLEMLLDPFIFSVVGPVQVGGGWRGSYALLAEEVADAVESDQFGYTKAGVLVSNFCTPQWFGAPIPKNGKPPGNAKGMYDFMGHCTAPFQLLAGGYIGQLPVGRVGQWGQVTAKLPDSAYDASGSEQEEPAPWTPRRRDGSMLSPSEIPRWSRRGRRIAMAVR